MFYPVPPFSVLDCRQGYWRDRKRTWLKLGIKSELGRDAHLIGSESRAAYGRNVTTTPDPVTGRLRYREGVGGTSIFDPVLSECAYIWWTKVGHRILDPFAGGSVRGVVAGILGREYVGVELRTEQVKANIIQAATIFLDANELKLNSQDEQDEDEVYIEKLVPTWITGDSAKIGDLTDGQFDFIFSCPPYYNLEVYSDLKGELSAAPTYKEFIEGYRTIIAESCKLLKDNRFACFVVGDVRNKKSENGEYFGFVQDTISAFEAAGLQYYNEGILLTSFGTLRLRVGTFFPQSRKLGKTHQNILVFLKGDATLAAKECGEVFVHDIELDEDDLQPETETETNVL